MHLLFKGARVVSPADGFDGQLDVLVEQGRISQVAPEIEAPAAQVVPVAGKILIPGLVDLHTHIGEPGREERETLDTGSRAAARGGFTTLLMMPDTDPPLDTAPAVAQAVRAAGEAAVRVKVAGALTKRLAGAEMAELHALVQAGAAALVVPDSTCDNAGFMRRLLQYARGLTPFIAVQPHDPSLVADGVMHEGKWSLVYGMKGIPASAEETVVTREILLVAETGCPLHLSRISTAGSVRQIAAAKAAGIPVTCDVSPHHLLLSDAALGTYDPNFKLMPPLRSEDDVAALVAGLADGTIDCIATDHTPLTAEEKDVEFSLAPFGAVGLETAFAALYTRLVLTGRLSLNHLVRALAHKPAQLLHLPDGAGTLAPGAAADFTIIDPAAELTVTAASLRSRSKNSPWLGHTLAGWPAATYVGGRCAFAQEGDV